MSLTSTLHVARSALTAHSYGVRVASDNIANVNTPGYARRQVQLSPQLVGAGSATVGGVNAEPQSRVADTFLDRRYLGSTSSSAFGMERQRLLSSVESLFDESLGGGIGSSLDAVFSSFSALSTNPSSAAARSQVLLDSAAFADSVGDVANAIAEQRVNLGSQATELATSVNGITSEIAQLNEQIVQGRAVGGDTSALEDRRYQAMEQLAEFVDFSPVSDDDGYLSIHVGGTALVQRDRAKSFQVDLDSNGNLRYTIAGGGSAARDVTRAVSGGELAAVRSVRDTDLVTLSRDLDQLAYDVGSALNAQHAAGYDQNGTAGGPLFDLPSGPDGAARAIQLSAAMVGHPERVAAAANASANAGDGGNALALAGLRTQQLAAGGTRTPNDEFARVIAHVGSTVADARSRAELSDALKAQAFSLRDSLSGVSLDEEMLNLTQHQRAYEAATRVIQVVDEMLQELLARV